MKIVINRCFGGFSVSEEAYKYMGLEWDGYGYLSNGEMERNDPKLVECVETLGEKANGSHASLEVVEIPDDVDWYIHDYDGQESIHENHRSW